MMSSTPGSIRNEADRPAGERPATFALEFFGEIGLAGAVTAQIGHVHANLLAVDVDNGREHRRQAGAEPVRRLLVKFQYR